MKLLIRNETSQTRLLNSDLIFIRELKENGLMMEVPKNSCQKGHSITLFFVAEDSDLGKRLPLQGSFKEADLEIIAKVESLEISTDNLKNVFVDLVFTQLDVDQWKKIMEIQENNQKNINRMFLSQHQQRDQE